MATELRFQDMLDRATNFIPWKERNALMLEENEIWNIVEKTRVVPIDPCFWRPTVRKM
jgi:hypothetical protein